MNAGPRGYIRTMADGSVHDIVGVFDDEATARRVATRIGDLGVPVSAIRVDDPGARVASLKGEMREEADNTIVGAGNVGPFTKGMTKGILTHVAMWTVGFAVLGCLLALFDWPASNLEFGSRLIIAAIVGAVTGATIGFVWGGGWGAANEPSHGELAAERGVVVAVSAPATHATRVVEAMKAADPIRLDLGSPEGSPIDTVTTEEEAHR